MTKRVEDHALEVVSTRLEDACDALTYLIAPESDQYVRIMDILEASVSDLTPAEIGAKLNVAGEPIADELLEARLDKLRGWAAVSGRTNDRAKILRHTDLLARNWRYTATPIGRQVHRFYRKVLAGKPALREIPLVSLGRVVETSEALLRLPNDAPELPEFIGRLFVSHDDLDAALVGAEDSLADLVDRFDLNDEAAMRLKSLLVGYATHVAVELERGSTRVLRALVQLEPRFEEFVARALGASASEARQLIERGALAASRGGSADDWKGLLAWFNPVTGRAERFVFRLVRAVPGMHINLRRLHSSSGAATSRTRALALVRACANATYGTSIFLAAVGDHSWRKFHGTADDTELLGNRSWRDGPRVEVAEMLRLTGRSGARGRPPAARDDTAARAAVSAARALRAQEHERAIREILAVPPGAALSEPAARVALASLAAAARATRSEERRTAVKDGLSCTLFTLSGDEEGRLLAPYWRVLLPGRIAVFHLPGTHAREPSPSAEVAAP